MDGLDRVDLLPEPSDRRILSAIDPSTSGYHDEWRAEVTGWAPRYAEPIAKVRRTRFLRGTLLLFRLFLLYGSGGNSI